MEIVTVNAIGDACPIPVVKTKKAIAALAENSTIEVLVDNETAVQNLLRLAKSNNFKAFSENTIDGNFKVSMDAEIKEEALCDAAMPIFDNEVVVFSSEVMGSGDEQLGKNLMKAFVFALSQQEKLPKTMIFYNGGVKLSTQGSSVLEDLKKMADKGVEILSCGTCLNFYGLSDKLAVGSVSNMYDIVEKLTKASKVIKP